MGKHDIRLRRQRLTARGADRFRNYGAILKQHEEEKKIKKIVKAFTYFLVILILIVLIVIVSRWEKKAIKNKNTKNSSAFRVTIPGASGYEVEKHQLYGSQEEPRQRFES